MVYGTWSMVCQSFKIKNVSVPIYMDLHIIPGVKAKDVANAHLMDVMIQKEHSATCMTYWIDEARGHVFCLIDAPSKEVVTELHDKAHGLVPHKIIEVEESIVQSFLGRVTDPEDAIITDGLKIINDPSYRILVVIGMPDLILLQAIHGKEISEAVGKNINGLISELLRSYEGMEAEHDGSSVIASLTSASKAISFADSLQQKLSSTENISGFTIGIHAGEPVTTIEKLFGETIRMAESICFIAKDRHIGISAGVRQLLKDYRNTNGQFILNPSDDVFLESLFKALEENWQDAEFNMEDYCHKMAMSRSQLYRKTVALTSLSPNSLLKEYRLDRAKNLLKKKAINITQVTFDTGFSSPSYFTKCFKKRYGILPLKYAEMANRP